MISPLETYCNLNHFKIKRKYIYFIWNRGLILLYLKIAGKTLGKGGKQ